MIEDEGAAQGSGGAGGMARRVDGLVRRGLPRVPPEVIITTIKNNQKCFCLREAKTGKLANKYLLVSNIIRAGWRRGDHSRQQQGDCGAVVGCEVLLGSGPQGEAGRPAARSSTAITFHAKLGSQGERVKRIEALAGEIAKTIGADVEKAKLAARLAKADLRLRRGRRIPRTCRA